MNDSEKLSPRFLAAAGCVMIGLGVGFFFFRENIFAFIGCGLLGFGAGLFVAAFLPPHRGH